MKRIKMKKLSLALLLSASLPAAGQSTIREAFTAMPDSLLPYLSHSNRLDLLDYYDAKMKAEVTNDLGGKTELLALTPDSLSLSLNGQHRLDMVLVRTDAAIDSAMQVIAVGHTYFLSSGEYERTCSIYSLRWRHTEATPAMKQRLAHFTGSTLLRRDDNVFEKLK